MDYKYKKAILGGTFDHLHRGHKHFLSQAFENARQITIGLTTQDFTTNKFLHDSIESYDVRKKALEMYLAERGYNTRTKIIPISDIYGNSLSEKDIDVIFLIDSNKENVEKINAERKKIGFSELAIVKILPVLADDGEIISSTRIRKGEIDREGFLYINLFKAGQALVMPDSLREDLKKPFGEIVTEKNAGHLKNSLTVAVGDIVVSSTIKSGVIPNIGIFDGMTKREEITDRNVLDFLPKAQITLKNQPGTINCDTILTIQKTLQITVETDEKVAIKIEGEEDLLALAGILLSPLDSTILYGLRDVGEIAIIVTERLKREIKDEYIAKFRRIPLASTL